MGDRRTAQPRWRRAVLALWSPLVVNAVPAAGVLWLSWNAREVLLLYWFETVLLLLAQPLRQYAQVGWVGLVGGVVALLVRSIFVAAGTFFLLGLLYGVDWENANVNPIAWSAPADGEPADWLARAWPEVPLAGVLIVTIVVVANLIRDWPQLRRSGRDALADDGLGTRLTVLHLTVILGFSAIFATGGATALVLILILLKTAFEGAALLKNKPTARLGRRPERYAGARSRV